VDEIAYCMCWGSRQPPNFELNTVQISRMWPTHKRNRKITKKEVGTN